MKHTRTFLALVLGLALPLNIAAAQSDPLADLFAEPVAEDTAPAAEETAEVATEEVSAEPTEELHSAAPTDGYLADVTGVTATDTTETSVTLTWDAVDGADNYTVYYGTTPIADTEDYIYANDVLAGNATTYTIEDLTAGTTYYISVTAENLMTLDGSEFYSEEISVMTESAVVAEETSAETLAADVVETVDAGDTYSAATPEELPQSGPLTGLALAGAAAGAYALRRLKKN